MVLLDQLFCDIFFVKTTLGIQIFKKFISEGTNHWYFTQIVLWYEFLNDLDAQSDFEKRIVTKKVVK